MLKRHNKICLTAVDTVYVTWLIGYGREGRSGRVFATVEYVSADVLCSHVIG